MLLRDAAACSGHILADDGRDGRDGQVKNGKASLILQRRGKQLKGRVGRTTTRSLSWRTSYRLRRSAVTERDIRQGAEFEELGEENQHPDALHHKEGGP